MLRQAVERAVRRTDVLDAVRDVYARLQHEIDVRKPICSTSGRCCRFEKFDHRLYVTTLELAAFVQQMRSMAPLTPSWDGTGCPYQIDGLCSVHTIRPFGCRVFFCDSTSDDWQHAQYERFHAELKSLHNTLGVRYFYVEWRQALQELGFAPIPNGEPVGPPAGLSSHQQRSDRLNPLSLPVLPL